MIPGGNQKTRVGVEGHFNEVSFEPASFLKRLGLHKYIWIPPNRIRAMRKQTIHQRKMEKKSDYTKETKQQNIESLERDGR